MPKFEYTKEIREKMRQAKLKNPTKFWKGKKFSKAYRKKLSDAHIGKVNFRGKDHPNWKGGITRIRVKIWWMIEYRQWRSDIFFRDNFTCQICELRGGKLEADHFPKLFSYIVKENNIKTVEEARECSELWDFNNGRTLCKNCHKKYGKRK